MTVTRSFTSCRGASVCDKEKSRPDPSGYQAFTFTPFGIYSIAMRTGLFSCVDDANARVGTIASSQGRPRLTPAPRRSVLRDNKDLRVVTVSIAPSARAEMGSAALLALLAFHRQPGTGMER